MSSGILVVSNIKRLPEILLQLSKHATSLYIHLNVSERTRLPASAYGNLISKVYMDFASSPIKSMDVNILVAPLKGFECTQLKSVSRIFSDTSADICEKLQETFKVTDKPIKFGEHSSDINEYVNTSDTEMYNTVVLGGTFDRIHLGHKILLTQAVLKARKRLVVGVTTAEMTKSKVLPELILPLEERISLLRKFLLEIDETLQYEIVPIDDPFGPTQHDPDMDLIVVSSETKRGALKINDLRASKGLNALKIFVVDLVETEKTQCVHESKISSSNQRIEMLGCRIRKVEPRPNLPAKPYIIGLTGGIAAGKSNLSKQLSKLGAHVLECDKIAHELYKPGNACYKKVLEHFGRDIINEAGEIDRVSLGKIVFNNSSKLAELNGIIWPEVRREIQKRIAKLRGLKSTEQPKVVVIEAALLVNAGWSTECHEIWSMIIPPEEAVRRLMERNRLSEEEARQRVNSLPSNHDFVSQSHVVFSAQWDYDFTLLQLEKAWRALNSEIK